MASFAPPPSGKQPMGAPPRGLPPEALAARARYASANKNMPMGGPPKGIARPQQMRGAPGAVNPYRNPKAITPELLAQMARRRLGG